MGHIIDEHGLHKSPDKIETVLKCAIPENVPQLRSFFGLINYYHKFLPNLSSVVSLLRRLLEKDVAWEWSSDCKKAFDDVRSCIASEQVMTHYNPDMPLKFACVASSYSLGAVLSHVFPQEIEKPIAFASRSLSNAEKKARSN